jgi:hypothetical protein
MTMPMVSLFLHGGIEAVLAIAHKHLAICNRRE